MHQDPLCTNAWNSLIMGCKLWIFMSPNVPKDIALGTQFRTEVESKVEIEDEAVGWYHRVYPSIRKWFMQHCPAEYTLIEVVQYPGETIFVPNTWWHAVLNINSDTLSITHNYVSSSNFTDAWRSMRIERPHTAQRWRHALSYMEPATFTRLVNIDRNDKFVCDILKPKYCCQYY
uniref:Bifunctional arginine demethylase and lysyl-hydroxylase JMJD6 n=1 Tax=Lygus hesperus TaxID=30085 RepID=A0A0A9YJN8_LYGHE